jgi:hypothetical protein
MPNCKIQTDQEDKKVKNWEIRNAGIYDEKNKNI